MADEQETAARQWNWADVSPAVRVGVSPAAGLPLRAVVSKRSLKNGGVELKLRKESASRIVPLAEVVQLMRQEVNQSIAEGR